MELQDVLAGADMRSFHIVWNMRNGYGVDKIEGFEMRLSSKLALTVLGAYMTVNSICFPLQLTLDIEGRGTLRLPDPLPLQAAASIILPQYITLFLTDAFVLDEVEDEVEWHGTVPTSRQLQRLRSKFEREGTGADAPRYVERLRPTEQKALVRQGTKNWKAIARIFHRLTRVASFEDTFAAAHAKFAATNFDAPLYVSGQVMSLHDVEGEREVSFAMPKQSDALYDVAVHILGPRDVLEMLLTDGLIEAFLSLRSLPLAHFTLPSSVVDAASVKELKGAVVPDATDADADAAPVLAAIRLELREFTRDTPLMLTSLKGILVAATLRFRKDTVDAPLFFCMTAQGVVLSKNSRAAIDNQEMFLQSLPGVCRREAEGEEGIGKAGELHGPRMLVYMQGKAMPMCPCNS